MSNTETETRPAEAETTASGKGRKSAGYVVLKEITAVEDLTKILEEGDVPVFAVYEKGVHGRDAAAAIKSATVGDDSVDEGIYVAVPVGSFKTREVRQVVQVTLN